VVGFEVARGHLQSARTLTGIATATAAVESREPNFIFGACTDDRSQLNVLDTRVNIEEAANAGGRR
jgi:hypothetical protein